MNSPPLAQAAAAPGARSHRRIAVVGAGAFGGWTALHLLRQGANVTLLDAWGPGHVRSSSGGETRLIRATYGPQPPYYRLVARSLELWQEHDLRWDRRLYHKTGLLWLAPNEDDYERASLPLMAAEGIPHEVLTTREAGRRFPQFHLEGVAWAIYEPDAGYLLSRRACAAVVEAFVAEGGEYRQLRAVPEAIADGLIPGLSLSDGSRLVADEYVFAAGPWLGRLFPDIVDIAVTRQEVFYFGTPAGDHLFQDPAMPAWVDHGPRFFYGMPGNEARGFKLADDTEGPKVDPELQERVPSAEAIHMARAHLAIRFPALRDAPLIGAEVCQYEKSADGRYIADRHPEASNVWLVGGGSGHGFKNGPAFGEYVAQLVLSRRGVVPYFGLKRLDHVPPIVGS